MEALTPSTLSHNPKYVVGKASVTPLVLQRRRLSGEPLAHYIIKRNIPRTKDCKAFVSKSLWSKLRLRRLYED